MFVTGAGAGAAKMRRLGAGAAKGVWGVAAAKLDGKNQIFSQIVLLTISTS